MATIGEKMSAIANAIRTKTGKTSKLNLDTMASDLNAIAERTESDLTASGAIVTVPAGNYKTKATKSVATTTQAAPNITFNSDGLIAVSVTQDAGYVAAGTKSATKQITTKGAATITPGVSNQTIDAGVYLTGAQTIVGDENLVAENIILDKSIFGVVGTHNCEDSLLDFQVLGGTTQPSGLTKNTLWVNTSLPFDTWSASVSVPDYLGTNGIWIKLGASGPISFDSLNSDTVQIQLCPIAVYQFVNDSWVDLTDSSMLLDGTEWVGFETYLFKDGNQYINLTGGWQKRQDSGSWTDVDLSGSTINVTASAKRDYGIYIDARTKNLIDVTSYNELSIVLDEFIGQFKLSLVDSNENEVASVTPTVTGAVMLSLVNITGSYYINLYAYGHDSGTEGNSYANAKFTVSEVKLS